MSTTTLTPTEFRAEWLKNLRSGEFSQVRSSLVTMEGSCCLGVAARMLSPENATIREIKNVHVTNTVQQYGHVRKALGFGPCEINTLVELNDEKCFTFSQIADYVEDHFS